MEVYVQWEVDLSDRRCGTNSLRMADIALRYTLANTCQAWMGGPHLYFLPDAWPMRASHLPFW